MSDQFVEDIVARWARYPGVPVNAVDQVRSQVLSHLDRGAQQGEVFTAVKAAAVARTWMLDLPAPVVSPRGRRSAREMAMSSSRARAALGPAVNEAAERCGVSAAHLAAAVGVDLDELGAVRGRPLSEREARRAAAECVETLVALAGVYPWDEVCS